MVKEIQTHSTSTYSIAWCLFCRGLGPGPHQTAGPNRRTSLILVNSAEKGGWLWYNLKLVPDRNVFRNICLNSATSPELNMCIIAWLDVNDGLTRASLSLTRATVNDNILTLSASETLQGFLPDAHAHRDRCVPHT